MTGTVLPVTKLEVGSGDDARSISMKLRSPETAQTPALVWLGGYRSDMDGTKAVELDRFAASVGAACIRFDYSGHGISGGDFMKGTISRWLEESLAVVEHASAGGPVVLVGSSMGGWIALLLVKALRRRGQSVQGIVLIAPAPDFTHDLVEPALTDAERRSLEERGYFEEISQYSPEPNIFTRALIEDGSENRVLTGIIDTGCPVHILQGMNDDDVPWRHAMKLVEHLPADDVVLTLVRDGDHRLSRPDDIARMLDAVAAMIRT